jgi:hypothetical protein
VRHKGEFDLKNVLLGAIVLMFFSAFVLKTIAMTTPPTDQIAVPEAVPQPTTPQVQVPYEASFTGEYICLPHKDTSGEQTLECALGLKVDNGLYIAMDMSELLQSNQGTQFTTGSKLLVKGTFVPIEQISTDHWQQYPILGILKVKEASKL